MGLSQEFRELKITTPLGADVLAIERVSGSDALGRPFEFVATAVAENDEFSFDDLMGEAVTVALELSGGEKSYFNGLVTQIQHSGYTAQGHSSYDLTLAPWLWFLTQASNCRIFQNKTVPEIIESVFGEYSVADFDLNLSGNYPTRDYCVQYRETDFNFVQRLMEHEGIYYYWEHNNGSHKMILCDAMSAHKPAPGAEELVYRSEQSGMKAEDYISSWKVRQKITSASYALNSFNFKSPSPATNTKLLSRDERAHKHSQGEYKLYDFPADFIDQGEGDRLASIRLEEIQCETKTIVARSNARALAPGFLMTPQEVPRDDQSGKLFLITAMSFQATAGNYGSGTGSGEEPYICSFTAIPSEDCVFRPARSARIPRMQGLQTAMVTGPGGEEIFVDKYGRVKVQFHWDREGQYDDRTSCWIRVSQAWAGVGFGSMNIPRIGQEVIIDFIEGNPDNPIITGRVYNGSNMPNSSNAGRDNLPGNKPPKDLTQAAMMTSFKSNSLGGSGGSNEITMNDAGGSETFLLKAQKDEFHNVGNDRTDTVGNDEKITIGNDRTEEVGNDEKVDVANNQDLSVGVNRTRNVGANESVTVGANQSVSIGSNQTSTIAANAAETIGIAKALSVGVGFQTTVGASMNTSVGLTQTEQVGMMKHIIVGNKFTVQVGGASLTMESSGKITLKGSSIEISASGPVKVNGSVVDIN